MWDSAGLERYRALIPSYVRGAALIFIIYDISSKDSFINLQNWINFIKQVNTDNAMIVLCGNKIDLERRVTTQEGKTLANKEQMLFFEVSAKNGENINKMMYSCITELPFFEQFQFDNKEQLIKELEGGNNKKEQNSIYDIVKEQKNENEKQNDLNVNGQIQNQNTESPGVIVIKRQRKRKCC
jgi:GTPase SAR1 family protein